METVYAALLLHKAEKKITESAIEKILKAADAKVDKAQIKSLVAGLEGKNIEELIASAAAAAPVAAAPAAGEEEPKKKSKKKKEEKKEEEEPTGIGALFG